MWCISKKEKELFFQIVVDRLKNKINKRACL